MRALIAAVLLATAGTPAVACSYVPSPLSWEDQLKEEKVVFIGTVLMIDEANRLVLFAVDEPIRGVERMWLEVPQGDGADCGWMFASAGTQFIYAGSFIGGPTREITTPLDDEELAALAFARSLTSAP
jgi:hypothetical protein